MNGVKILSVFPHHDHCSLAAGGNLPCRAIWDGSKGFLWKAEEDAAIGRPSLSRSRELESGQSVGSHKSWMFWVERRLLSTEWFVFDHYFAVWEGRACRKRSGWVSRSTTRLVDPSGRDIRIGLARRTPPRAASGDQSACPARKLFLESSHTLAHNHSAPLYRRLVVSAFPRDRRRQQSRQTSIPPLSPSPSPWIPEPICASQVSTRYSVLSSVSHVLEDQLYRFFSRTVHPSPLARRIRLLLSVGEDPTRVESCARAFTPWQVVRSPVICPSELVLVGGHVGHSCERCEGCVF
ncbi:hypothetical protein BD324DRAFT_34553 [Kockovaella imperatae]|uniref:Uncharacterized protein n=1 Tax=Kockovaella imperatae TaxID=4999 RepID=A0A1Y1USP4_9TREE|nr:hypothetical protein BD324DRAFT_34553 [Kockovaella imperatae]ORX41031.1 hypothetical protein BD324DRAFT_34553 [Kockovaella imperatae]